MFSMPTHNEDSSVRCGGKETVKEAENSEHVDIY
jgi:hypothetical protein